MPPTRRPGEVEPSTEPSGAGTRGRIAGGRAGGDRSRPSDRSARSSSAAGAPRRCPALRSAASRPGVCRFHLAPRSSPACRRGGPSARRTAAWRLRRRIRGAGGGSGVTPPASGSGSGGGSGFGGRSRRRLRPFGFGVRGAAATGGPRRGGDQHLAGHPDRRLVARRRVAEVAVARLSRVEVVEGALPPRLNSAGLAPDGEHPLDRPGGRLGVDARRCRRARSRRPCCWPGAGRRRPASAACEPGVACSAAPVTSALLGAPRRRRPSRRRRSGAWRSQAATVSSAAGDAGRRAGRGPRRRSVPASPRRSRRRGGAWRAAPRPGCGRRSSAGRRRRPRGRGSCGRGRRGCSAIVGVARAGSRPATCPPRGDVERVAARPPRARASPRR